MKLNKEFFNGKRILNVGCGEDTFGTDFVDLYPSRKEVIKVDIDVEPLPYPDETFDVVYSRANFEHLSCPRHFLKEAYRVLKKNGILIIITDNANYLGNTFNENHHGGYGSHGNEDIHYGLYTPKHLEAHCKNVGFRKISIGYCDGDLLSWRTKNQHKFLVAKIFGSLSKVNNKYFKRMFSKMSWVIAVK